MLGYDDAVISPEAISRRYYIEEPVNIAKHHEIQSQLPSSILASIPHTDIDTTGKFAPYYIKLQPAPAELYPRQKAAMRRNAIRARSKLIKRRKKIRM